MLTSAELETIASNAANAAIAAALAADTVEIKKAPVTTRNAGPDGVITMGDIVQDTISKFTGVCDSIHEYYNGCSRIGIASQTLDKDGKPIQAHVFDVQQVKKVGGNHRDKVAAPRATGGPHDEPSRDRVT